MKYRIERVDAAEPHMDLELRSMQLATLPGDPVVDPTTGEWWVAREFKTPIAYAGLSDEVRSWPHTAYLCRVGVLEGHRGHGLQRRLMNAIERRARGLGYDRLISTTYANPPSANNFIRCGYKTYEPQAYWGAPGTIYWLKELN